ncbi:MAG: DUF5522 domain-containing protein [Nanoarchaeota archaeon]
MDVLNNERKDENLNKSESDNDDFYIENGLMVFTEKYHLKGGYCCENSCRHFPYGFSEE